MHSALTEMKAIAKQLQRRYSTNGREVGKSLYRLLHVPLGFYPNYLATIQVTAPDTIDKNDRETVELSTARLSAAFQAGWV
jgi:hypothetical protein